jgi:ascorbate-specific PTS system EIIC-type component UlaA
LNFSIFRDSSACSIEIILTSFFCNFLIVSIISSEYSQSTESEDPKAVFFHSIIFRSCSIS